MKRISPESEEVLALAVGEGTTFEKHEHIVHPGSTCRLAQRVINASRYHNKDVAVRHTGDDGEDLFVMRIS